MSPGEIEQAVRRCDRRRRWPWNFFWGFLLMVVITNVFMMNHGGVVTPKVLQADSQATSMAVFNALYQFHIEYDYLPMPTSGAQGGDWDTDSSAAENIIAILKALDTTANPKAMDFLGDIKDAKHVDGEPRNGLVRDATTAALVDPWATPTSYEWMATAMASSPIRPILINGWQRKPSSGLPEKTAIRKPGRTT